MKKVFFSGIKGGTGTTVTVANLASALTQAGESVICIDLDAKNELRLHFGDDWDNQTGWLPAIKSNTLWAQFAYTDDDGVTFIPHGSGLSSVDDIELIISQLDKLDVDENTWLLMDCPSSFHSKQFQLGASDLRIQIINCDPNCHSLIYQNEQLNRIDGVVYQMINKFNASAELEAEIYHLWRDNLIFLAPFFIHFEEAVRASLAFKNIAYNCAPHSVVIDDYIALASWLKTKMIQDLA